MDSNFMGHDINYWIELEKRAKTLDVADYIQEIADLRGKVSFYEDRIKKLSDFMQKNA